MNISASILPRKASLGSKLGESGSRNPFMYISNRCRVYKSEMSEIHCVIPHFLAYKGFKRRNSVRIRLNEAEKSKYEIEYDI